MSIWLERLFHLFQIAAVITGFAAAILEIVRHFNPELGEEIRKKLPKLIKHRVFTHTALLLAGIAVYAYAMSYVNPPQSADIYKTGIYKTYEWQWAGENWYGRVTLDKKPNGENVVTQARVGLVEKVIAPGTADQIKMYGRVLELVAGTFEVKDNHVIEISLAVQKKDKRTNTTTLETINGTLQEVPCYAGTVFYSSSVGSFQGDMVLVGYKSSLGPVVEDWFREREPGPPWVDYKR